MALSALAVRAVATTGGAVTTIGGVTFGTGAVILGMFGIGVVGLVAHKALAKGYGLEVERADLGIVKLEGVKITKPNGSESDQLGTAKDIEVEYKKDEELLPDKSNKKKAG